MLKYWKPSKFSVVAREKHADLSNGRVDIMKPLRKAFSCVKTKINSNFAVKLPGRSNRLFFVYLIDHPVQISVLFNPIQDGPFRGCSPMGKAKKAPFLKICHTYPTMMKLGTFISYLKKIQKMYESSLDFCWHQRFFIGNQQFCYIKKYRYKLHFGT